MAVTLPQINITFSQLASSIVSRSERGIAILIIRDATDATSTCKTYTDATEVTTDSALYTAANAQYIKDALVAAPLRVTVVRIGASGTIADAVEIITKNESTGWITVADGTAEDWTELCSWIKARENEKKSWKAVVYQANSPDSMHIVNFVTATVTFSDDRGAVAGSCFLPSLIGILAACNIERGATNYLCSTLTSVSEESDPDAVVGAGKFILINLEGEVRVGVDVNSLVTTNGTTLTEDMMYIETVEAMDIIRDDIRSVFRTEYVGAYRNTKSNQMLFIAAVNEYLLQLAKDNVLDSEYDNVAAIDVSAQRAAWVAAGTTAAADWTDAKVRSMTFKRQVFLTGDIKILGSMADLTFPITLA